MRAPCLVFLTLSAIPSCAPRPELSERQVLLAAEPEMEIKFRSEYKRHRPYRAEFRDASWWVHGTGATNGGTVEARVEDGTGKVLSIWHTQ